MNVVVAPTVTVAVRAWSRLRPKFDACARGWIGLRRRDWLLAAGLGGLFGMANAWIIFFNIKDAYKPAAWPGMIAVMHTRWAILMVLVACALAFALALLRDLGRRGAIRPRQVVLAILGVTAWGAIVDPIAVGIAGTLHFWLQVPTQMFTVGSDSWFTALSRMWGQTSDKVFTLASIVTLSMVYVLKTSRASDALASAQLRLMRSRRQALAEELRTAQAALDPAFLFGTLAEVDQRFDPEPEVAQRMLDALIRYLRAALPGSDELIGNLGQQAALARAWFEIEAIRSGGRLVGDVQVPTELESRPFAPALVLPLVALAAASQGGAKREVHVGVTASVQGGRLIVEVWEDGSEGEPRAEANTMLDSLRRRIATLYGQDAQLSFVVREPRGSSAKIVIDDPGGS